MSTVPLRLAGSVPLTALDLCLEEIHLQRRANLHDWKESNNNRILREENDLDSTFSDDEGKDLEHLSLLHTSWTSISRRILERILIISNPTVRSARAAASSPTVGEGTREVYLSFSRDYDEAEDIWDAIKSAFAKTPNVLTFCLQTGSRDRFRIHLCVKKLSEPDMLDRFVKLRKLQLYNDILHGSGAEPEYEIIRIAEHPALFLALKKSSLFKCLMVRNFLPSYNVIHKDDQDEEVLPHIGMNFPDLPDSNSMIRRVGSSASLDLDPTQKIRRLAELIGRICNSPITMTDECTRSVGNAMQFAAFTLDSNANRELKGQFNITTAKITESEVPGNDKQLPDFKYEWCNNLAALDIGGVMYNVFNRFIPSTRLTYLHSSISASPEASRHTMRDELLAFLASLPPTLEILEIEFFWEDRGNPPTITPGIREEFDNALAAIPAVQCTNLKVLAVNLVHVAASFSTPTSLERLVASCSDRGVALLLPGDNKFLGTHDAEEVRHILRFESHIL